MKKEMIERIENAYKEKGDFETYVVLTDQCFIANGKASEILALLASMVSQLKDIGVPEDLIKHAVEVGLEEEKKDIDKIDKQLEKIQELLEKVEKVINE